MKLYEVGFAMITVLISGIVSVITALLTQLLIEWKEKRQRKTEKMEQLRKEHINPLRLSCAEFYYRIFALKHSSESLKKITEINDAREVMSKQDDWYAGNGCFLGSSCYLIADLLCQIENIRKSIPFLHLKQIDDTKLMETLNMISADFSKMGLYFVLQMDIGNMFHDAPTYRQFCGELQNNENTPWYLSFIQFALNLQESQYTDMLLNDVKELAKYLDLLIDGGDSIEQKLRVEKSKGNL